MQFGNNLQQKQTITIQTTKNAWLATYNMPRHIKPKRFSTSKEGCRKSKICRKFVLLTYDALVFCTRIIAKEKLQYIR